MPHPRRAVIIALLVLLCLLVSLTLVLHVRFPASVTTPVSRPPSGASSVSRPLYWGASIAGNVYGLSDGAPTNTTAWDDFEAHAGKKVSILHFAQAWYGGGWQSFPTRAMDTIINRGAIPLLSWSSWDYTAGQNQSTFSLQNVAIGTITRSGQTEDDYLRAWATDARAWGHPFFLRFDQEMNGWWQFPWATAADPTTGVVVDGNTPELYIAAWKHVHDIFASVGATNVTWVWCPNVSNTHTVPMARLYPGDRYVDWTCLDGYNDSASNWQSFAGIYGGDSSNGYHNSYQEITTLAPSKPLMIGEISSVERPGDRGAAKAAWISDALGTQIPLTFPLVRAILWFNHIAVPNGEAYQIESSVAAQHAFAMAIASPRYLTNTFGNLSTSPIPPAK